MHLVSLIRNYESLLNDRNIFPDIPDNSALMSREVYELRNALKELIILARTPS